MKEKMKKTKVAPHKKNQLLEREPDLGLESLKELFEKQVQLSPQSPALLYQEECLDYAELNQKANQMAHYLSRLLKKNKEPVLICLPRSVESIISLLAVLKSGNTYVPVARDTPSEKLKEILADCRASLILTLSSLAQQTPAFHESPAQIISLDEHSQHIAKESTANMACSCPSNQVVYILYTSGSTGKPKGVQITQSALVHFLWAMQAEIAFTSQDLILAITPFTFDISGLEIYLPLITGGSLVLLSESDRTDTAQIAKNILQFQVTMMQATPALWQMLINSGWSNPSKIKMLCGGEGLSTALASALLATGGTLWNVYGPTETTIWSTAHKVQTIDKTHPLVPIGKPLANTEVYVLDQDLQPVPVGIPGSLYIAGKSLAKGYLNQPQLTEKYFIPNPFSPHQQDLMYYTGDQVLSLTDGSLVYLGRLDDQIKIRGFRIELGEIESCLLAYPGVSQAAVVSTQEANPSNNQILAYLVLDRGVSFDKGSLFNYLESKLFRHMLPSQLILMEALPLSAHGKIDKKALKSLATEPLLSPKTPENEIESILIDLIKPLLKLDAVEPESNFFNLGMNSLLLNQLVYSINNRLDQQINVIDLFSYSSIRTLANFLRDKTPITTDNLSYQRAQARRSRFITKKP